MASTSSNLQQNNDFDKDFSFAFGELLSTMDDFKLSVIDVHRLMRKVTIDPILLRYVNKSQKSFKISFANSLKDNTAKFVPNLVSIYSDSLKSSGLDHLERNQKIIQFIDSLNSSVDKMIDSVSLKINNHFLQVKNNILKTVQYFKDCLVQEFNRANKLTEDYDLLKEEIVSLKQQLLSKDKQIDLLNQEVIMWQEDSDKHKASSSSVISQLESYKNKISDLEAELVIKKQFSHTVVSTDREIPITCICDNRSKDEYHKYYFQDIYNFVLKFCSLKDTDQADFYASIPTELSDFVQSIYKDHFVLNDNQKEYLGLIPIRKGKNKQRYKNKNKNKNSNSSNSKNTNSQFRVQSDTEKLGSSHSKNQRSKNKQYTYGNGFNNLSYQVEYYSTDPTLDSDGSKMSYQEQYNRLNDY